MPTHDPSLDIPLDPTSNQIPVPDSNYIPLADANAVVSQDEAFSRALSAMYWGGYWTAMYHVRQDYPFLSFLSRVSYTFLFSQAQRQLTTQSTGSNIPSGPKVTAGTAEEEEEDEDLEEIEINNENFTSTQR